jgi:hypothetical protein
MLCFSNSTFLETQTCVLQFVKRSHFSTDLSGLRSYPDQYSPSGQPTELHSRT